MTKIHEILLVPASQGRVNGVMSETEIVRRYVRAVSDELDHCAVRHRIGQDQRPWEFTLSLGLGWLLSKKEPLTNRSRLWISDARSSPIGVLLAETLSHWGTTYIGLEHRSCKPVARQDAVSHIHIEPFELNGLRAASYAQRLEELGRDIGRTLADYVVRQGSGGIIRAATSSDMPQPLRRVY